MTSELLRQILFFYLLAQFALTVIYLCSRKLSAFQFLLWGALALFLPALGPFLVIAARAGKRAL